MYRILLRNLRYVLVLVILCLALVGGLLFVRGPLQAAKAAPVLPVCGPHIVGPPRHHRSGLIGC